MQGSKAKKGLTPESPTRTTRCGTEAKKESTIYKVKNKILLMDEGDGTEE